MAETIYDGLELIVRYDGTKTNFEKITDKSAYYGKVVFISGDSSGKDQAIWIHGTTGSGTASGKYLSMTNITEIEDSLSHIKGIKVGTTTYPASGGAILTLVGTTASEGWATDPLDITVKTDGTVTFDVSAIVGKINGLNSKVNEHTAQINTVSGVANQAKDDSMAALGKIDTLIGTTAGDDAKSARKIAEEEANKVYDALVGTGSGGDSLTQLRSDIDAVTEAVETLNGNDSVDGSVDKKIKDAINEFATNVSNDDTINTFKELVDYVAGVDGGDKLATAIAQINANKGAIETLNGSDTTAGSVDKKVKDAIDAEVNRANGAYATKAQGAKADSAIQSVTTTTPDYTEVTVPVGEGADSKNKVVNVKTTTMQQAIAAELTGTTVGGVVPTQDIYNFLKARLSVKVVS